MKLILQRYLFKEFFRVFIPSLAAFEFLLVLGLTLQSLYKGVNIISILLELGPYFTFYALPYALPTALLASTVITYGRLSNDNEIWAILTCGVHLRTIVIPVAVLGLLFSLFSLGLNAEVLPRSYQMLKTIMERATHKLVQHLGAVGGRIALDPYYIYIKGMEGDSFKEIAILRTEGDKVTNVILAEEGHLGAEADENLIICALRQGQFINLSASRPAAVPNVVPFKETTFVMPLGLRERKTFKKYMPLHELLEFKRSVKRELKRSKEFRRGAKLGKRALKKRLDEAQAQYDALVGQIAAASLQAEKSREAILKQEAMMVNINNEMKVSENYIRIAEDTMKELLSAKELDKARRLSRPQEEDIDSKIEKINQTVEEEKGRIATAQEQIRLAQETIEREKANQVSAIYTVNSLEKSRKQLQEAQLLAERVFTVADNVETVRDIDIAIQRRLAPSFACLAFVLIGIPIGIMSRMGNMVVGFFISFGIALVVYYPLLIGGEVLANDMHMPIFPSMWAANILIVAIAAVLLIKVFRK